VPGTIVNAPSGEGRFDRIHNSLQHLASCHIFMRHPGPQTFSANPIASCQSNSLCGALMIMSAQEDGLDSQHIE
jgi:hypothetical protein